MKCFAALLCFFFLTSTFVAIPTLAQQNGRLTEAQLKALSEDANFLAIHHTAQQIDAHFAQSLVRASVDQLDAWIKASKKLQEKEGSLSEPEAQKLLRDLTGLSDKDAGALGKQVTAIKKEYPTLASFDKEKQQRLTQYVTIHSLKDHAETISLQDCRNLCFRKTAPKMQEVNTMMSALLYTNFSLGLRRQVLVMFLDIRIAIMEEWRACMGQCLGQ